MANTRSDMGGEAVIHSQCSTENSWDGTLVSFQLFFDRLNEVTNSEALCYAET